jgi:hypothetical protein
MTSALLTRSRNALRRVAVRAIVFWSLYGRRADALPEPEVAITGTPIFVGGTGRSGTTIVAKILGAHPAYHMIPFELRFLSDKGGLCDLVDGKVDFATFAWKFLDRWSVAGPSSGKRRLVTPTWQRAALRELQRGIKVDRAAASARFVHRIVDQSAVDKGASGWIEMTPGNVHVAPALARMWPKAKLVHAVRDGRDVACSVTPLTWGPRTYEDSLAWWAASLADAFEACATAPAGFVHTLRMEALLGMDRDAQLASLLAFVGLDEAPSVREFFDGTATAARANLGRWRTDIPADEVPGFVELHEKLAAGLNAKGYRYVPFDAPGVVGGAPGDTVAAR